LRALVPGSPALVLAESDFSNSKLTEEVQAKANAEKALQLTGQAKELSTRMDDPSQRIPDLEQGLKDFLAKAGVDHPQRAFLERKLEDPRLRLQVVAAWGRWMPRWCRRCIGGIKAVVADAEFASALADLTAYPGLVFSSHLDDFIRTGDHGHGQGLGAPCAQPSSPSARSATSTISTIANRGGPYQGRTSSNARSRPGRDPISLPSAPCKVHSCRHCPRSARSAPARCPAVWPAPLISRSAWSGAGDAKEVVAHFDASVHLLPELMLAVYGPGKVEKHPLTGEVIIERASWWRRSRRSMARRMTEPCMRG
jgi:hypothetical protein